MADADEHQSKMEADTAALEKAGQSHESTASSLKPQQDEGEDQEEEAEDWKVQLERNKAWGDDAFRAGGYKTAIQHYTAALSLDPTHAVLLSNRSAAYLKNGEKSKALYDAQQIGDRMGVKGFSRLAAALQSLGRYQQALEEWTRILQQEPNHQVALEGTKVCKEAIQKQEDAAKLEFDGSPSEPVASTTNKKTGDDDDSLDEFFNDVEDVAVATKKQQLHVDEPVATEAIRSHKKDLGTAKSQTERLLAPNYKWLNLNPFHVLDIPHTATVDDISRRYKALSLLLHPDKNRDDDPERAQEAYDQVLKAKEKLSDENKARHVRQLIEEGMRQGEEEWQKSKSKDRAVLQDLQTKAVQKIFATAEYNRQQVEERQRNQEKRERQQEEEQLDKERKSREFDNKWKDDTRVDKRIGNWRDFAKSAPKKQKKNH